MIGLEKHERDRQLPKRLGDAELVIPEDPQILAWVRERLCTEDSSEPAAIELQYARWKPRVAVTATWRVSLVGGVDNLVTFKRHLGGKAAEQSIPEIPSKHFRRSGAVLLPAVALPDGRSTLSTFPFDRALPGAERVMNSRRTARALEGFGLYPTGAVRRSASRARLLRYKPGRRAVFRFDVVRRGKEERAPKPVALRVLPPREASRIVEARSAFRHTLDEVWLPRLVASDSEHGTLIEEWIVGDTPAPDAFDHAERVANLLARLHRRRPPASFSPMAQRTRGAARGTTEWTALDPDLERSAARCAVVDEAPATAWVHGDFHPDQVLLSRERDALVDLDALRPGEPAVDLASWIADRLARAEEDFFEAAEADLCNAYVAAGGIRPDRQRLRQLTASALFDRAAAALRRLEAGGLERARRLAELAAELSEIPGVDA